MDGASPDAALEQRPQGAAPDTALPRPGVADARQAIAVDAAAPPREIDPEAIGRLDRAQRLSIAIAARRDALRAREAELVRDLGESKGRLALKPEVEEVIDELQRFAHERSLGAFERMLTAIVDDVMPYAAGAPRNRRIRLELGTERNLPALDIFAEQAGKREDITSGAMANIVSTGLRFITLARSGLRRFMVLDESDCFVDGESVHNFFSVVNQLSRDAGIQTLVITHHDLTDFTDDFRIYRLSSVQSEDEYPATAVDLVSPGYMDATDVQQDWLSHIALENFEAYPRARIELSPGVTAIQGPNRHCKSGWARALRAALLGDASDSSIRHGHGSLNVRVGVSDGRELEYRRVRRGSPKAEYLLHGPERAVDPAATPLHHSPTARIPDWVGKELGMATIDGLNVQIWPQLKPVFMLDEPASRRAALLSIGRESGYLFAMTDQYREDLRTDNGSVREGERELAATRLVAERLESITELAVRVEALKNEAAELARARTEQDADTQLVAQLRASRARLDAIEARQRILSSLAAAPQPLAVTEYRKWVSDQRVATLRAAARPSLSALPAPEVAPTRQFTTDVQAIEQARRHARLLTRVPQPMAAPEVLEARANFLHTRAIKRTRALVQALESVRAPAQTFQVEPTRAPADAAREIRAAGRLAAARVHAPIAQPAVEPTRVFAEGPNRIRAARDALAVTARAHEAARAQAAAIYEQTATLVDQLGGECPTCHGEMDADAILGVAAPHQHTPREARSRGPA